MVVPAARARPSPQLLPSSTSVSAVSVHHESEDLNVEQKEVSLSALSADYILNAIIAAVATTAHPGVARPYSVHSHQSKYPSKAKSMDLAHCAHAPTPSPAGSSSSLPVRTPYPSSCLPSVKEMMEDYGMARYENKRDK